MNNTDTWWVYKLQCVLMYGSHPSIEYPLPGYVQIDSAGLCAWLKIPSVRLRKYLQQAQDMDMIEDLRIARGFVSLKISVPGPLA